MTVELYDFRDPGKLPQFANEQIEFWCTTLTRELGAQWSELLGTEVEPQPGPPVLCRGEELQRRYAESASLVQLKNRNGWHLFLTEQRTAVRISAAMLGGIATCRPETETETETEAEAEAEAETSELTDMELDLIEMLLQNSGRVVDETCWKEAKLPHAPGKILTWADVAWTIETDVVIIPFQMQPLQSCQVEWLIPATVVEELALLLSEKTNENENSEDLVPLVKQLPVELVVRLGCRQLEMHQLINLKPGDVIVLDQRINKPLVGLVDDTPKFQGWPGKVGTRQAFQVSQ